MNKQTQKELLDIVRRNYEEIAEDFNETRQKYLWPELYKLAEEVKDKDSVLDAGCGNGRLIEAFKNKKINYTGIDSSEKLIGLAKEKYGSQNFNFQIIDILELTKLPQINFNHIFCIAVLQHIPGKDLQIEVLRQLKNKVSADGKIILAVWNLWSQLKFRKLILKFALLKILKKNKMDFGDVVFDWKNSQGESISKRYYHAFTRRALKKLIKKAGLKIEKIYKDKYNYYAVLKK